MWIRNISSNIFKGSICLSSVALMLLIAQQPVTAGTEQDCDSSTKNCQQTTQAVSVAKPQDGEKLNHQVQGVKMSVPAPQAQAIVNIKQPE